TDAGRAASDRHLRGHQRPHRRRPRPPDQGVGEGAARVHGGAASRDCGGDSHAEGALRRSERAATQGDRGVQGALMAKPRELKRRIRSVQNTKKITKTMELVSTSKLKRAQDRVVGARPYAQALADVIGDLYSPELAERFPLLRQPALGRTTHHAPRTALLLITSNRGLCGAFNANLIREARRRLEELERQDAHTELHVVGKKGVSFFKFTKREPASRSEER